MKHLVAPSMLSSDFANLERDITMVNQSNADWFHLDVMDGRFVPNITFGFPVIKAIRKTAEKPLDVHLMIVEPEKYIDEFKNAGADILTVHYEASTHLHRTLQAIKNTGMQAGVAINPHTSVDLLEDTLDEIDLVCLMSVNPGFGGQSFISNSIAKIKKLNALIEKAGSKTKIEVDGGITLDNALDIIKAGADVLVAGNTVFSTENPQETIALLKTVGTETIAS